jgi:hypothetical protein
MVDAKTDLENIQGYRTLTVMNGQGGPEEIRVKKLNVYELQSYAQTYGDQGKMVELFTGRLKEWIAELPYESVDEILTVGEEINDPILTRFLARDGKLTEKMATVLAGQVSKRQALASALQESVSRLQSSPDQTRLRS